MNSPRFIDIHRITDEERMDVVARMLCSEKAVAFVVEAEGGDGLDRANRCIGKLRANFPELEAHVKGPTEGLVTVMVLRGQNI